MTLDGISYTQLASIVAFVAVLFGLYRVLVSTKDATIELLGKQVEQLKAQTPDAQFEALHRRNLAFVEEIGRRNLEDAERNRQLEEAQKRATREREEAEKRRKQQLEEAQERASALDAALYRTVAAHGGVTHDLRARMGPKVKRPGQD